jgi:NAD(P)-dependent dehydrogenase (short-subunit alcohol dehydrogenase family)
MLIANTTTSRMTLHGHVAVVTGAGQGIGKETARALAYLGASVAIAEINESGLETQRLIQSEGGIALFVKTDVADPASMEHLHRKVQETFGDVDILVNNAAAFTTKPVLEHTVEEWDRIFAVNLRGAFLGIKAFLPTMLSRRQGVILTMESAEGMPFLAPYLASKVGLRSLALSLAQELGEQSGVSVYCFGPGVVATPSALESFRQLAPRYGLSLEEFIQQTGIPLVSAEVCATGLVGTILFAPEFHGQETG